MKKELKDIIYGIIFFVVWFLGMYAIAYYTQSERLMIILKAIILIFVGIFGVCLAVGFVLLIFYIFGWTTNKTLCAFFKTVLFLTETEEDKLRKMEIESENRELNK